MSILNKNALVSLFEVRDFLFKSSTATYSQAYLEQLINYSTDRCIEYIGRELTLNEITEFYDGKGRGHLFLTTTPIQSIISLWDDVDRNFTSAFEISVTSNVLIREDIGKLELWNEEAGFVRGKQNIKVRYRGGYDLININSAENDRLDFKVGTSSTLTATFTAAHYESVQSLINHIQTRMNAVATSTASLNIAYNYAAHEYTVKNSTGTTLQLLFNSGSNKTRGAHWKLGFSDTSDKTGATRYKSDYKIFYIPGDLKQSIIFQTVDWYKKSFGKGDGSFGESGRNIGGVAVQNALAEMDVLPEVLEIWDRYRFINIEEI